MFIMKKAEQNKFEALKVRIVVNFGQLEDAAAFCFCMLYMCIFLRSDLGLYCFTREAFFWFRQPARSFLGRRKLRFF